MTLTTERPAPPQTRRFPAVRGGPTLGQVLGLAGAVMVLAGLLGALLQIA